MAHAEPDAATLVKLRFFAGLTATEAAEALGMSSAPPTTCGPTPAPGSAASYRLPDLYASTRFSLPSSRLDGRIASRTAAAPRIGIAGRGSPALAKEVA
ncbi:MAG: ECF-type sigma factor [Gemmataceae bacterium]